MSQHEIYALKYAGPFVRTGAHLMWYQDWDRVEKINYYIWCIKGAGTTVVVDAGVTPQLAKERGLEGYVNPVEVLSRINVAADEVRHADCPRHPMPPVPGTHCCAANRCGEYRQGHGHPRLRLRPCLSQLP